MVRHVLIVSLVWCFTAVAQTVPPDRSGLLNGEGMGLAAYAEANGYPGPKHVLELASDLALTSEQMKKTGQMVQGVVASATVKGEEIVEAEEALNALFASRTATERDLRAKLEQIGKLRGELRFIHMQAHVKMKQVLSEDQVEHYRRLRKAKTSR